MPTLEDFLNRPIEALERALHIRKQIEALKAHLTSFVEGVADVSTHMYDASLTEPKKRIKAAPAKARIAAAQRARWTKQKEFKPAVPVKAAPEPKPKKKGGMSAEGRSRIVAAQKARWVAVKAKKSTTAAQAAPKKKRQLSPEARARIVAAVKARWARAKKGK